MDVLIGDTGLIGGVLQEAHCFQQTFNSSNLQQASLSQYDIDALHLACLPAQKWKANLYPVDDFFNMQKVVQRLRGCKAKEVVLYSTIDVYKRSENRLDYGTVRHLFELLIAELFADSVVKIVRLPALFHSSFKKNALYDLLNNHEIEKINGNSAYQWYSLDDLWGDVKALEESGTYDLFSATIETSELIDRFFPGVQVGYGERIEYQCGTIKYSKDEMLSKMEAFINAYRR